MEEITKELGELEEDKVLELIETYLSDEKDPIEILKALQAGMDIIGKRYENNEYFLSDLIFSAEIFENASAKILPNLKDKDAESLGKIILGTVKGDVHDIGKNIIGTLLKTAGFEVIDIGVDQSTQDFINAIKKHQPDLIGLSGLLTTTFEPMKETISEIKKLGHYKIMIGGGIIDKNWCNQVGADDYTTDAMDGLMKIKKLLDVA